MRLDSLESVNQTQSIQVEKSDQSNEEIALEKSKEISVDGYEEEISNDFIDKSIEKANKSLEVFNRRIEREVHEKTHKMIFRIIDKETDEVIKEYPPEKIQDMLAKMWELAGLFVDEKA